MSISIHSKMPVIIGGASGIGLPPDISTAALLALTNPFLTGTTVHVDGGHLA
jgi:hypothetical protein